MAICKRVLRLFSGWEDINVFYFRRMALMRFDFKSPDQVIYCGLFIVEFQETNLYLKQRALRRQSKWKLLQNESSLSSDLSSFRSKRVQDTCGTILKDLFASPDDISSCPKLLDTGCCSKSFFRFLVFMAFCETCLKLQLYLHFLNVSFLGVCVIGVSTWDLTLHQSLSVRWEIYSMQLSGV